MKERLAQFQANNPSSTIDQSDAGPPTINKPWGDTSLTILLLESPNLNDIIDALNNLILPERFTAIWHVDTQELEVIFTVFPVSSEESNRSFEFTHRGNTYQCAFGESSKRVLLLAEYAYPVEASPTDYRNLIQFSNYVFAERGVKGVRKIRGAKPLSFWIRGLKQWQADLALDMARHLNFYMAYYDTQSPQILIHSPTAEIAAMQPETRFREGRFPKTITGRQIDENLLHFYTAASENTDPIRCFINNYLILEYAAFFYIQETSRRNVRQCLADPSARNDFDTLTRRILEAIGEKMQEPQRVQHILKHCVRPKLIWDEIQKYQDFFSRPAKFQGGFTLEPLVTKSTSESEFSNNWEITFESKIREIRNALSHGKDQRTLQTISPTTQNFQLIERWVPPIAVAAREVMVYRDTA